MNGGIFGYLTLQRTHKQTTLTLQPYEYKNIDNRERTRRMVTYESELTATGKRLDLVRFVDDNVVTNHRWGHEFVGLSFQRGVPEPSKLQYLGLQDSSDDDDDDDHPAHQKKEKRKMNNTNNNNNEREAKRGKLQQEEEEEEEDKLLFPETADDETAATMQPPLLFAETTDDKTATTKSENDDSYVPEPSDDEYCFDSKQWRLQNWGTSEDVHRSTHSGKSFKFKKKSDLKEEGDDASSIKKAYTNEGNNDLNWEVEFDPIYTPNSPPLKWFTTVAVRYPSLRFHFLYGECYGADNGYVIVDQGHVIDEFHSSTVYIELKCVRISFDCHKEKKNYSYDEYEWDLWNEHCPNKKKVKAEIQHYEKFHRCWDCSMKQWLKQRNRMWHQRAKQTVQTHIKNYIIRRLYRYPDGLRLSNIKESFERNLTPTNQNKEKR